MTWYERLVAFFEMGGHALYVWGAYVLVTLALVWEGLLLWQRWRRAAADLPPPLRDTSSEPP